MSNLIKICVILWYPTSKNKGGGEVTYKAIEDDDIYLKEYV